MPDGEYHGHRRSTWLPVENSLETTDSGEATASLKNVVLFLRLHPEWEGVLGYDEFTNRIIKRRRPPFVRSTLGTWDDRDERETRLWLAEKMREPRRDTVRDAVLAVAERNAFNSVTDYLDRCRDGWDGIPRVRTWLSQYVGACKGPIFDSLTHAEQTRLQTYTQLAGQMWLIAAATRAYRPGCHVDFMLIFEGDQGEGKSTALRILGGDWFTDSPFDLTNKDSRLLLRRFWIIEMAELESLARAWVASIKAFLSQRVDEYRPPYGAAIIEAPRHCIFAGTANHREYLRDPTGNRRFWPISTTHIEVDALGHDRDQLWGEAASLSCVGQRHWPSNEERPLFEEQQASRLRIDPWTSAVLAYIDGRVDGTTRRTVTASELLDRAVAPVHGACPPNAEERIGRVMSRLAWTRKRMNVQPRSWYYERP